MVSWNTKRTSGENGGNLNKLWPLVKGGREGGNENHHFTLKLLPLLTKTWKTISSFLCFPSFYLIACIYTFRITVHRAHNLNVLLMEAPDLIRKSHWLHYFKFNQTWVNLARELKESSCHALSSSKILEKYFN